MDSARGESDAPLNLQSDNYELICDLPRHYAEQPAAARPGVEAARHLAARDG